VKKLIYKASQHDFLILLSAITLGVTLAICAFSRVEIAIIPLSILFILNMIVLMCIVEWGEDKLSVRSGKERE